MLVGVAALLVVAVVVVLLRPGGSSDAGEAAPTATAGTTTGPTTSSAVPSVPTGPSLPPGVTWGPTTPDPDLSPSVAPEAAKPVSVRIPSIGVSSDLITLGTDPKTGVLVPPESYQIAGWFGAGPRPGDVGPAVIAGHVDSKADGPGVFFTLRNTAVGAKVLVTRADGTTVTFTAYAVGKYPKDEFPTAEVYGPTPDAQLRVITCGGDFDYSKRSYVDNIVVYARLDG